MTSTDPQQPSTTTPDPAPTDATAPAPEAEAEVETAAPADATPEVAVTAVVDPGTVRRAPRFKAFAVTGIVVGLIVSAALNVFALEPGHPGWSRSILTLEVTLAGLVVGVLWALVADHRSRR